MFAAASGARLAHRHDKTVKKQISASQLEGLQVQYKSFQRQQQLKYSDTHASRFAGVPHRRPNYATKLYCDPNLKLSSSYVDINGRIARLGHVDFEGKAAWQDREANQESEQRVSVSVPNEAAVTHRTKQREAHSRWVKRNRIHDLSFGDCSSDEELLYGVQSGAANLLLYVGLGTMCVGMIIAFVGTGEKGFKTMELRLIGPSLIGAGVLIIILRIMLCVCPSKCLKLKKQKQKLKNSTNKLNSEGRGVGSREGGGGGEGEERKKRVSMGVLPTTSGAFVVPTTSHVENEKAERRRGGEGGAVGEGEGEGEGEEGGRGDVELELGGFEVSSSGSEESMRRDFASLGENLVSPENSDVSITSLVKVSRGGEEEEVKASKFEVGRIPKNQLCTEIVLDPSSLAEGKETE